MSTRQKTIQTSRFRRNANSSFIAILAVISLSFSSITFADGAIIIVAPPCETSQGVASTVQTDSTDPRAEKKGCGNGGGGGYVPVVGVGGGGGGGGGSGGGSGGSGGAETKEECLYKADIENSRRIKNENNAFALAIFSCGAAVEVPPAAIACVALMTVVHNDALHEIQVSYTNAKAACRG